MFFCVHSVIFISGVIMSAFTDRVDSLLNERNLRRADLCRGINISESSARTWYARGACPSAENAFKVAQFFGVSVEYLLTGNNPGDVPNLYLGKEEEEIIEIYRSLDKRGKNELFKIAQVLEAAYSKEV